MMKINDCLAVSKHAPFLWFLRSAACSCTHLFPVPVSIKSMSHALKRAHPKCFTCRSRVGSPSSTRPLLMMAKRRGILKNKIGQQATSSGSGRSAGAGTRPMGRRNVRKFETLHKDVIFRFSFAGCTSSGDSSQVKHPHFQEGQRVVA